MEFLGNYNLVIYLWPPITLCVLVCKLWNCLCHLMQPLSNSHSQQLVLLQPEKFIFTFNIITVCNDVKTMHLTYALRFQHEQHKWCLNDKTRPNTQNTYLCEAIGEEEYFPWKDIFNNLMCFEMSHALCFPWQIYICQSVTNLHLPPLGHVRVPSPRRQWWAVRVAVTVMTAQHFDGEKCRPTQTFWLILYLFSSML